MPAIGSGRNDRNIVPRDVWIPRDEHEPSQLRLRHQQAVERVTVVHGQIRTRFHVGELDAEHLVVVGDDSIEASRNV